MMNTRKENGPEQQELEALRNKLEKETGFRIEVPETEDAARAAEMLERLLLACGSRKTADELLIRLLTGDFPFAEQPDYLQRLKLQPEGLYAVFLICLPGKRNGVDPSVIGILQDLFGQDRGDRFVDMGDGVVLFLNARKERLPEVGSLASGRSKGEPEDEESPAGIPAMAEALLDTMNLELMLEAKVACSRLHPGAELKDAYLEAKKALDVGMMFSGSEHIYYYDTLGVRRLIFDLPEETCLAYLNEIFDGEIPDRIDDELIKTARAFFENGMNISDTAKKMFIHRNTLIYRLEKLCRATGLDIRRFEDAFAFRNVALIYERLRNEKEA